MIEAGTRKRNQPAPPHVVFEALTLPDAVLLGHLRTRLNVLINANLRYTFGQ